MGLLLCILFDSFDSCKRLCVSSCIASVVALVPHSNMLYLLFLILVSYLSLPPPKNRVLHKKNGRIHEMLKKEKVSYFSSFP